MYYRFLDGVLQYSVQWVGYMDTTWEPAAGMTHAQATVADFHRMRGEVDGEGQWVREAIVGDDVAAFVRRAEADLHRAERRRRRG